MDRDTAHSASEAVNAALIAVLEDALELAISKPANGHAPRRERIARLKDAICRASVFGQSLDALSEPTQSE